MKKYNIYKCYKRYKCYKWYKWCRWYKWKIHIHMHMYTKVVIFIFFCFPQKKIMSLILMSSSVFLKSCNYFSSVHLSEARKLSIEYICPSRTNNNGYSDSITISFSLKMKLLIQRLEYIYRIYDGM